MNIRPLEQLSKEELIDLVRHEREQASHAQLPVSAEPVKRAPDAWLDDHITANVKFTAYEMPGVYYSQGWRDAEVHYQLAAPVAAQAHDPRLDKPALVGNGRFGVGVKWSTVIGAAQRLYEYEVTPDKEAKRIKEGTQKLNQFREQVAATAIAPVTAHVSAEPVANDLGAIRVGRLPTMNHDEYPGLGDWWVQLRVGSEGDEVLARVYGETPEQAHIRAVALAQQSTRPQRLIFPTMLRKMWSGGEVQAWLDEQFGEIAELTKTSSQQETDKVDAKRYRYLRDYRGHKATGVLLKGILFNGHESKARTDEVIDAARKEQA